MVTIAAGKTITLTIKLNGAGRELMDSFKRLPVELALSVLVGTQHSMVAATPLTVREPSKGRHS